MSPTRGIVTADLQAPIPARRIASTRVSIREHFVGANQTAWPKIAVADNAMTAPDNASAMKR
jgi:hypothetical protein